MPLIDKLQLLANRWCEANERSLSRLATVVANDGKLFDRLAGGATCTVATLERFLAFFRDPANWPAQAIPADIVDLLGQRGFCERRGIAAEATDQHRLPLTRAEQLFETGNADDVSASVTA